MTHELFENFDTLDDAMDYIVNQNTVNADLLEALQDIVNIARSGDEEDYYADTFERVFNRAEALIKECLPVDTELVEPIL